MGNQSAKKKKLKEPTIEDKNESSESFEEEIVAESDEHAQMSEPINSNVKKNDNIDNDNDDNTIMSGLPGEKSYKMINIDNNEGNGVIIEDGWNKNKSIFFSNTARWHGDVATGKTVTVSPNYRMGCTNGSKHSSVMVRSDLSASRNIQMGEVNESFEENVEVGTNHYVSQSERYNAPSQFKKRITPDEIDNRLIFINDDGQSCSTNNLYSNVIFLPDKSKGASPKRYGGKRLGRLSDDVKLEESDSDDDINKSYVDKCEVSDTDKNCGVTTSVNTTCKETIENTNNTSEDDNENIVKLDHTFVDTNVLTFMDDHFGLYTGSEATGFSSVSINPGKAETKVCLDQNLHEKSNPGLVETEQKPITDNTKTSEIKGELNVEVQPGKTNDCKCVTDQKNDIAKQDWAKSSPANEPVEACAICDKLRDECLCLFPKPVYTPVTILSCLKHCKPVLSYYRYLKFGSKSVNWSNLKSLQATFAMGLKSVKTHLPEDNRLILEFNLPCKQGFEENDMNVNNNNISSEHERSMNTDSEELMASSFDSYRNLMVNDFDDISDDDDLLEMEISFEKPCSLLDSFPIGNGNNVYVLDDSKGQALPCNFDEFNRIDRGINKDDHIPDGNNVAGVRNLEKLSEFGKSLNKYPEEFINDFNIDDEIEDTPKVDCDICLQDSVVNSPNSNDIPEKQMHLSQDVLENSFESDRDIECDIFNCIEQSDVDNDDKEQKSNQSVDDTAGDMALSVSSLKTFMTKPEHDNRLKQMTDKSDAIINSIQLSNETLFASNFDTKSISTNQQKRESLATTLDNLSSDWSEEKHKHIFPQLEEQMRNHMQMLERNIADSIGNVVSERHGTPHMRSNSSSEFASRFSYNIGGQLIHERDFGGSLSTSRRRSSAENHESWSHSPDTSKSRSPLEIRRSRSSSPVISRLDFGGSLSTSRRRSSPENQESWSHSPDTSKSRSPLDIRRSRSPSPENSQLQDLLRSDSIFPLSKSSSLSSLNSEVVMSDGNSDESVSSDDDDCVEEIFNSLLVQTISEIQVFAKLPACRFTVLCVDTSGSMEGGPWQQVKEFISNFLSGLNNMQEDHGIQECVALVTFGQETKICCRLSNDYEPIITTLNSISPGGCSPLCVGYALSLVCFVVRSVDDLEMRLHDINLRHRIIVLTDGWLTPVKYQSDTDLISSKCITKAFQEFNGFENLNGVSVNWVPIGDYANITFFESVCATGDVTGKIYQLSDVAEICRNTYLHYICAQVCYHMFKVPDKEALDVDMFKSLITNIYPSVTSVEMSMLEHLASDAFTRHKLEQAKLSNDSSCFDDETLNDFYEPHNLENLPHIGDRVTTGPDNPDLELISGKGTVTGHCRNERGKVFVKWDRGAQQLCSYGCYDKWEILPNETEEAYCADDDIKLGDKVRRGPDWCYGNDDGGMDEIGAIYDITTDNVVWVRWSNGNHGNYRYNQDGMFDVLKSDPKDPTGNQNFVDIMNERNKKSCDEHEHS
ncbi:E3 ubiquitin-protein ligase mib2 [Mactra antiquata]